ncbi:membrane-associated ring finger (C3HC4) 2 [Mus musculus]|nr:membrane-associated ring finger (C3HC4) 2 [Mus musculus]
MTTGDCCHLPGSLCDCSSSPAFSKVVEATGLGPPQYVAQVTSRDGRLLSTVIRALDSQSTSDFTGWPAALNCHPGFGFTEWLKDPGPRTEKRTLCCDMVCFVFITPLAAISGWLCLRGAQDHLRLHSRLEAVGLIALTIALFTIYVLWTLVSFRYHCQLYSEWRKTNQKVRLKIREADGSEDPHHSLLATGLLKKVAEETPV